MRPATVWGNRNELSAAALAGAPDRHGARRLCDVAPLRAAAGRPVARVVRNIWGIPWRCRRAARVARGRKTITKADSRGPGPGLGTACRTASARDAANRSEAPSFPVIEASGASTGGRAIAVLAIAVSPAPVIGLTFAWLAFLANRTDRGWGGALSSIALLVAGLAHLATVVVFVLAWLER